LTVEKNVLAGSLPEREAISGAVLGDPACFESLYHLHRRRVYMLCLRITRNTADAEDLTQEVFLQLFRKVATFRGDSAFSTWLHRVAMNVVLMHLRKKTLPLAPEPLESQPDGSAKKEIGVTDQTLAVAVDRILLERSVGRLPAGYRAVFVLHDVQGYEHKEIAKLMGCSIGNSKSQLHKARLKLRSRIEVGGDRASSSRVWQADAVAA
jgi:RNA polymerase sigma-70 factor (ECF subfamily)